MRKTARCPPESTGFRTAGKRDEGECGVDVRVRAKARVRRLWEPARTERVAHRALVREEVRRPRSDARQAELLGDGGDDGDCAIGRHREHTVDADSSRDLDHLGDAREVDDLRNVGRREAGRVRVAVDRGHAQAAGARLLDRTALMAPCADEENRRHGRRC